MFFERTSVGLDVHARSVSAAAIDSNSGELVEARLSPAYDDVLGWVTDRNIRGTICRRGGHRQRAPPESMTQPVKRRLMAAYGDEPHSVESCDEQRRPGCVCGQMQASGSAVVSDSGGDGEQSQPQSFGFPPSCGVVGEGQHLEPGGELDGEGDDGQPKLVLGVAPGGPPGAPSVPARGGDCTAC